MTRISRTQLARTRRSGRTRRRPAAAWIALGVLLIGRGVNAQTSPAPSPFIAAPAPAATLDGTIQPVNPNWDPYADATVQDPSLMPPGGYVEGQAVPADQQFVYGQPGPFGQRLIQQLKAEYTILFGNGRNNLQMQDLEFQGTGAIPITYAMAPVLITPGFAFHFWSGPDTPLMANGQPFPPNSPNFVPDLPPRVYDAYLDVGWRPLITPRLSVDLGVRPGVYSDFGGWASNAFRIQGRGLAIFAMNPQVTLVGGVLYIDRYFTKLLPAGGIIWTPNEESRFEILFPRPKLAQRLAIWGTCDWWIYLAGEYGGGSWSIQTEQGGRQGVEYDDWRVILGTEWSLPSGVRGYIEGGYVFNRRLRFTGNYPEYDGLDDTGMLRAGVIY
jgi:hypothetical protein